MDTTIYTKLNNIVKVEAMETGTRCADREDKMKEYLQFFNSFRGRA